MGRCASLFRIEKINNFVDFFQFYKNGRSFFFPIYFLIREREKIKREQKGTTVFRKIEFTN
jgi:hypothetical protein